MFVAMCAMNRIAFVATVCLLLLSSAAHAARLVKPYVVEVPVASQGVADRKAAESAGLLLLLEKLSGHQVDDNRTASKAAEQPERYLSQFSYVQDGHALRLEFSPAMVDPLLSDAGLVLWPLDRPSVLLLMATPDGQFLPASSPAGSNAATAALVKMGSERGLPLLVPDPASVPTNVPAAPVIGLDAAGLAPSVSQYGADALLLGSVSGSDETGWASRWVLRAGEQEQRFEQKGQTLAAALDGALRQAAAALSGNYRSSVTADSGPTQLRLEVDGIRSFASYTRLCGFLEKLAAVQHISFTRINGTTVVADVDVSGRESFRTLVALLKPLQWREEVVPPPGSEPTARTVWRYQWQD